MGLINRAFGFDKSFILVVRLASHWELLASPYEIHLHENEVSEKNGGRVSEAKKGFWVVNFDVHQISVLARAFAALRKQNIVITKKPMRLTLANVANLDIVNGNMRLYQQNQPWFVV
jgi:hypothetical protein